ncbi:hypothetical protein E2C00_19900 [Streptomyces sp. WAC05374]|uniref:hypothetical protein n=1 Tax=Streptomyces sp. WAC05374 TaxID=2487420 RepID=UPI000F8969F2|nr:hypothetical protein [Streptomyces sp. WAC05374]RST09358.1 hypothetical protein EF905_29515 [Streptomyces sp. WAC05374]TDF40198.1 hypothetical protein E2B92_25250 [Streptomyces sp. WAC05374]TDF53388.1 hypothetical protein E2C00_19900 [Streptomyces sp. WAC05374]TDF59235.1 hypothetical protein E2C02_05380 [Streptomyces sp. WAC05374]
MPHPSANEIPPHLLMWQRVRAYAVPPSMIETATARRAVGDWAGACAAARVDVDLDLRAVRDRHGTDTVTRLRADLRRLAPDLLRWHMPRIAPGGRLRPGLTLSLARYPGRPGSTVHLVVRTPPARADAGQRMSLALWDGSGGGASAHHPHPHPDRRFRLDLHRHFWDAGRSGELAGRCGDDPGPWAVTRWAAEAEHLLRAEGRPRGAFTVRLGPRDRAVLELVAPDDSHAPAFRPLPGTLPPQGVAALPVLPEAAARVLPDRELLRAGLVPAGRLHPLVAAALDAPGPAPATGPVPASGDPHRVECRGEVHRIALRDGVLTAVDHDPDQLRREELLVALGGPPLPCLRAIDAVHRDPEALPAVRERLAHGDVTGALAVVEGLLGPRAVLRDGPLRDALESAAARRIDHGLFRSGLLAEHPAAGARRPRPNRRKRGSRARPRTGLHN